MTHMVRWGSLAILGTFIALGAAGCSPALSGQSAIRVATALDAITAQDADGWFRHCSYRPPGQSS